MGPGLVGPWNALFKRRVCTRAADPVMSQYGSSSSSSAGPMELPNHMATIVLKPSPTALAHRRYCQALQTLHRPSTKYSVMLRPSKNAHLQTLHKIAKQFYYNRACNPKMSNYGTIGQSGEPLDKSPAQRAAGTASDNPKLTITRELLRTTVAYSTSDSQVDIEDEMNQTNTLNF